MIALDTNVLVRVVTADDSRQLAAAVEVMRGDSLWLSKSVVLETEWVLRFTYRLGREAIARAFENLLRYPNLQIETPAAVARALDWYLEGLDFADALHLTSSAEADAFATFDRALADAAGRIGARPTIQLLRASD